MSRVTLFAARDPGPAARMSGFLAHLRQNGLRLGVAETELALIALTHVNAALPNQTRRALKAVCTGCKDEADRFDDLFDSFWLNGGKVTQKVVPGPSQTRSDNVHSSRNREGQSGGGDAGQASEPDASSGEAESDGIGKLIATDVVNFLKKDLREIVTSSDIAEAEAIARRLGAALKDRRSRHRREARARQDERTQPGPMGGCENSWSRNCER